MTVAPATPWLIDRGDLLAALDRAAARKVTIISAPAGSGKTYLLRAWADRQGEPHRLAVLQDRQRQIQIERNNKLIGATFELLVDTHHAARSQWAGRSTSNLIVNFTSPLQNLLGEYVQVHVTRAAPFSLVGEHVS